MWRFKDDPLIQPGTLYLLSALIHAITPYPLGTIIIARLYIR